MNISAGHYDIDRASHRELYVLSEKYQYCSGAVNRIIMRSTAKTRSTSFTST